MSHDAARCQQGLEKWAALAQECTNVLPDCHMEARRVTFSNNAACGVTAHLFPRQPFGLQGAVPAAQRQETIDALRSIHIDCVILSSFDSVFASLRNIWTLAGIRTHHAKTLEQADFLLLATGATVLISDIATEDCSWRSAVKMINHHHSLVAMLIVADPGDGRFLEDAPGLGVCGVIWKPIQLDPAIKLTRMAHQAFLDRRLLRENGLKRKAPSQAI